MTITYEATYSPEDNKLRLYASQRLDEDTYQQLKAHGFRWAPRQELFVAPAWSPSREDLCVKLAGVIVAEETTLAERAQAKAERLDALAAKRARDADAYQRAASRIGERFAGGQPILVGHHSERRARKDQERMHSAMDAAVKAADAVRYWNYRAEGVERHANYLTSAPVTARRIKTLLAELRGYQRQINHAHKCLEIWAEVERHRGKPDFLDQVRHWAGARLEGGSCGARDADGVDLWSRLAYPDPARGIHPIEPGEVVDLCLSAHSVAAENPRTLRYIQHTLHRLAYERAQLGEVPRYEGELTAAILQTFAREQGAEKPKATQEAGCWTLSSPVPLPAHIAAGDVVGLSADEWRDLMQQVGHTVTPASAKPKAPPLLNIDAESIATQNRYHRGQIDTMPVHRMTKAEYAAVNGDYKGTRLSADGTYRVRSVMTRIDGGLCLRAVFLTDQKAQEVPA